MSIASRPLTARVPRLLRFGIVGGVGFVVDSAVAVFCIFWLGLGIYASRLASYLTAASTTWVLHRHITFPDRRSNRLGSEWLRFVAVNGIGGAINYGVYALYMTSVQLTETRPVAGIALGSLAGLLVNYSLSRIVVFKADSGQRQ